MARSTEEDRVLLHIGDIRADHNYIGRAEMYPQIDRNMRYCSPGELVDVLCLIFRFSTCTDCLLRQTCSDIASTGAMQQLH